jgi:hypothetical protein
LHGDDGVAANQHVAVGQETASFHVNDGHVTDDEVSTLLGRDRS